jgi:hypothetical protein
MGTREVSTRSVMKKLVPFFMCLLIVKAVMAQTPEDIAKMPILGNVSDIQGLTKVYVLGATSDERKIVLQAFKREGKKLPFVIVNDPSEAEFFMNFGELSRQTDNTAFHRNYEQRDEVEVYYFNKDKKKVIVFTDTETLNASNGMSFSAPNSYNLTRNFFKAYKKIQKQQ